MLATTSSPDPMFSQQRRPKSTNVVQSATKTKPRAKTNHEPRRKGPSNRSSQPTIMSGMQPPRKKVQKYSMRTREKERLRCYNLTLDVIQLKQEIQRYKTVREILRTRARMNEKAKMEVVQKFFELFRFGCARTPKSSRRGSTAEHYLRSIVHQDIVVDKYRGVDVLIDQWTRYADCVQLESLDLMSTDVIDLGHHQSIVKCRGKSTIRITRRSVREIFPHVIEDEMIMQRLVGLKLQTHCEMDFFFQEEAAIVSRCDLRMGFLAAFRNVFQNPRELLKVVLQAKIDSDFFIGETHCYRLAHPTQIVEEQSSQQPASPMNLNFILS